MNNTKITRLESNPIITPKLFGLHLGMGSNINGPSLMKVPGWVEEPLGKYYLYFAHHGGKSIRLATAARPEGPYTLYRPGALQLSQCLDLIDPAFVKGKKRKHVASPEIFIDTGRREIRMYFHMNIRGTGAYKDQNQASFIAISRDGIHFEPKPGVLGPFYMRVFFHKGMFYSIAKNDNKNAILIRSDDGLHVFERGPTFEPYFRHCALLKRDNILHVFFTRAFELQESILHATMELEGDWKGWALGKPTTVLRPEREWEGANLPLKKSKYGGSGAANSLRDPCIYEEGDRVYLLYSVKGEKGIAIARIEGV
ncbi:MAG: hypothetical protein ACTSUE_21235 [Promethearchaeota archaeon]